MDDSLTSSFLCSLPQAPNVDISQIRGNITDEQKQLGVNIFFYFVGTTERSYGADIGQRLKIMEMNVWDNGSRGPARCGETIFEIEVVKGK
jgi:acyl-coenzyme A thioesterase 13